MSTYMGKVIYSYDEGFNLVQSSYLRATVPQSIIEHGFEHYLKMINTVSKNNINILKQIIWETQKWFLKF